MATSAQYSDNQLGDSKVIGILFALILHLLLIGFLVLSTVKQKPKEEAIEAILMEFEEEEIPIPRRPAGSPYRSQQIDRDTRIINEIGNTAPPDARIADRNQSTPARQPVETAPSNIGPDGDIEVPAPEQPKINQQSLYSSNSTGTVEGNTPNPIISEKSLFPGVGKDNEATRTANTPIGNQHRQLTSFDLSGRSAVGAWPNPRYEVQEEGRVVVEITVDGQGNVTDAKARSKGSTTTNDRLWRAAEEAAKKSKFSVNRNTPVQKGTITYIFKLN